MKKYRMILLLGLLIVWLLTVNVFASSDINDLKSQMSGVGNVTNTNGELAQIINSIIKLIQVAGSGIAVLVVTILGVKYMLASAGEKADLKKQAVPIVIGCVLLFAGVNIAALIADLGTSLNSNTSVQMNSGGRVPESIPDFTPPGSWNK